MGLISAIAALCKAVPILERLFLGVADAVREANAKARFNAKLDHIDNAMRNACRLPDGVGTEWSEGVDRSPTVPEGSAVRASLDKGGTSQGS
jgi:hypothetical protein